MEPLYYCPNRPSAGAFPEKYENVVFVRMRAILAKALIEQADIDEIQQLEDSLCKCFNQRIEFLSCRMRLLRRIEKDPIHFDYLLQLAGPNFNFEQTRRLIANHKIKL